MKKKKKLIPLFIILGILFHPISILIYIFIVCCVIDMNLIHTNDGLDYYFKYHNSISSLSLTEYWIPEEEMFWERYKYQDGDFHYETRKIFNEACFLYVKYDEKTYLSAKSFVIHSDSLCETHIYEYSKSNFVENLCLYSSKGEYFCNNGKTPINYVGYNDNTYTLFFIGFYISDDENQYGRIIDSNEAFIYNVERYLSDYLDKF